MEHTVFQGTKLTAKIRDKKGNYAATKKVRRGMCLKNRGHNERHLAPTNTVPKGKRGITEWGNIPWTKLVKANIMKPGATEMHNQIAV